MTSEATAKVQVVGGLLGIQALTSLHPGAGTALGTVDLPVQRERHTQWPNIAGSALKGILRDTCRELGKNEPGFDGNRKKTNEEHPRLITAFGPAKVDDSNGYAGALTVTDARILAFPVRSLRSVFAWITCPAVLRRLKRDLRLCGQSQAYPIPEPENEGQVFTATPQCPLLVGESKDALVLEEFEFRRTGQPGAAAPWADWLATTLVTDGETATRLKSHLVILHDDQFTHFVRHATEVVARIGLDYDKKTVRSGALFYQEFLPAETLLYAVVLANSSRGTHPADAKEMLAYVQRNLQEKPILQIGGDETIGKGICQVRLFTKEVPHE